MDLDPSLGGITYNYTEFKPTYLPKFELYFILDNKKVESERSKYTFFILLGDLGGFNGAIMIFPAYVMSFYSSRMYQKAISGELPVRKPRPKRGKTPPKLSGQVLEGQQSLSNTDVSSILS